MLPSAPSDRTHYPFIPGEFRVKHVSAAWEREGCMALRRAVFCREQGIFESDDIDATDAIALPIAAIACIAGAPESVVGTVRIHQPEPGLWYGSRLAVAQEYRRVAWLGSELIKHAVSTAHARGCTRFLATVQVQNVKLFQRLHWHTLDSVMVQGRPHAFMEADLNYYPPRVEDEMGFVTAMRYAA